MLSYRNLPAAMKGSAQNRERWWCLVLAVLSGIGWICAPLPARALTISEAVQLALKNNHQIKQYRNLTQAQQKRVSANKAPFLPQLDLGYEYNQRDQVSYLGSKNDSTAGVELSYNLFNGFSDLQAFRSSQSVLDASNYQQTGIEEDIAFAAKSAFIQVLRATANLRVASDAVTLLKRQKRDIELFYQQAMVAKNDVLEVEVELAAALQDELLARSSLKVARDALARVIGLTQAGDRKIENLPLLEPLQWDRKQLEQLLTQRSELKYLEALEQASQYTERAIKGGYIPAVDLSLRHEWYGDTALPNGSDSEFLNNHESRATLRFTWNLFDGWAKKNHAAAQAANTRSVREKRLDTEAELILQLEQALETYDLSLGNLGVARTSVIQAKENYRISNNQFLAGIATNFDLLRARLLLTRAQFRLNTALYDNYLSIVAIERVVERPLSMLMDLAKATRPGKDD